MNIVFTITFREEFLDSLRSNLWGIWGKAANNEGEEELRFNFSSDLYRSH